MNSGLFDIMSHHLFTETEERAYAVLDGASIPDLLDHLYSDDPPEFECLYRGELQPDLLEVAPYLVVLKPENEFSRWIVEEGWGNHWGIFVRCQIDMRAMRRHFRTFLMVHDPDGKPLYFRYYDPRVLRVYLPTCNTKELAVVFGPVAHYLLEDEDPKNILRFHVESGALRQEKIQLPPS